MLCGQAKMGEYGVLAEYLPSFCLDLLKGGANVFAVEVFLIGKKSGDRDK